MVPQNHSSPLPKAPTGIQGLDEITFGGLPKSRPTLVVGGAGSGKTLFALEFLVRGALQYDEPGVFMSFEESAKDLAENVASLAWDLDALVADNKLRLDYVHIERSEIEETGDYNLEGLFIRLGEAVDSTGAKRVVLDTVGALFSGFTNTAILRAELRRLFRWLKERGLTAIITSEPGDTTLTRYGLEEYVSDCVIALDHRLAGQVATRRMRIIKYRGTRHGTNEYPFLIGDDGFSVLPITSMGLTHQASSERIPTGIARLDTMLGGKGYFRGSSVLVSGTAGTGKTSIAAHFVHTTCQRGECCLYFAFEESPSQIIRNMRSIGVDLEPWLGKALLTFHAVRPSLYGLEMHLATMYRAIEDLNPTVVVLDPISNMIAMGTQEEVRSMMARIIDYLKIKKITALFTDLTHGGSSLEATGAAVSSLMDAWILLRDIEIGGERNRGLYVLKSRGMAHSNQIREFVLTDKGIDLLDVYAGPSGVLTGTARYQQEAAEKAAALERQQDLDSKQRQLEQKRQALEAQITTLRAEFEIEEQEIQKIIDLNQLRENLLLENRQMMATMREADRRKADQGEAD